MKALNLAHLYKFQSYISKSATRLCTYELNTMKVLWELYMFRGLWIFFFSEQRMPFWATVSFFKLNFKNYIFPITKYSSRC